MIDAAERCQIPFRGIPYMLATAVVVFPLLNASVTFVVGLVYIPMTTATAIFFTGPLMVVALAVPSPAIAQQRKPPYYAAISAGKARMRTGPGRNYPISWVYKRAHLPIKVVDIYQDWRRIEDPDGTQGWMQVGLLTAERTGMITGSPRPTPTTATSTPPISAHWADV